MQKIMSLGADSCLQSHPVSGHPLAWPASPFFSVFISDKGKISVIGYVFCQLLFSFFVFGHTFLGLSVAFNNGSTASVAPMSLCANLESVSFHSITCLSA
jgi:hypothetical protein